MHIQLLKSKILRAEVTDSSLNYEGSLGIDSDLMEMVGLLPYEKILVGDMASGSRFETYAIPAPAGSHTIALNGAVARLGQVGDLLVIMSFAQMTPEEAKEHKPRIVVVSHRNSRIVRSNNLTEQA
ncbi:MAG TPA: aspartate 1-decarboxylase [Opitutales bacterium]|nr:aspartate 1-decarboxylase [Opitutales bacterium]